MLSLRKSKDLIHHTEDEVYSILFQLVVYACMLVTSTLLALSMQDTYMYQFDANINRIFLKRTSGTIYHEVNFEQLITVAEWYDFLEQVFLRYWHNQDVATNSDGNVLKTPVFLKENFHIGVARLRQVRVKPNSCVIHEVFNRYFNTCFVRYERDEEDTKKVYKGSNYYTFKDLPVGRVKGLFSNYEGPGYVVFLTRDQKENENMVDKLKSMNWIDRATRLVLIEFVLYNSNMNMFINTKFITEVLPSGTLLTSYKVAFLPIHSIWSRTKPSNIVLSSIFYALTLFYTAEEIWFFKTYGFYNYSKSKWNWLDCAILVSAYVSLILSIIHPFRVEERLKTMPKNEHGDIFIDDLCYWHGIFKLFLAICTIFVWLKIFRFISFNVTMLHFSVAIRRCTKDILGFSVMFFIVFIAYSLLGLLLFSDINPGFSSFPNAIVTMMRMIMGDYQYQNIEKANNVLGPVFFISYILFIFFILLNMFLAIISDTYVSVREDLKVDHSGIQIHLGKIWQKAHSFLLQCCCRKKPTEADVKPDKNLPRSVEQEEALKEFYGSTQSSIEDFGTSVSFEYPTHTNETATEFERLNQKVKSLEHDYENLINKLDRLIQKLDAKVSEQRDSRGHLKS